MKWIAALLMVANVAIFLWVSGRHGTQQAPAVEARPDVNREGMLLLKELEPTVPQVAEADDLPTAVFDSSSMVMVTIDDSGSEQVKPAESQNTSTEAVLEGQELVSIGENTEQDIDPSLPIGTETAAIDLSCYRIGPFKTPDAWEAELGWMNDQGVPFQSVATESRELRAVRVFLGPYQSRVSAQATVNRLRNTELDHFIYEIEGGQVRISLGYFTQEELANKFVSHVKGQGFAAQSQPEYRILGPYNWMEAEIPSTRRNLLLQKEWAEQEVSILEVTCQSV